MNTLWHGDNLPVLRNLPSESVNLVYLDPPFKSDQNYNMLYRERDGTRAAAQIRAFNDTWTWDARAKIVLHQLIAAGGPLADTMEAFGRILGHTDMLAYLVMMAPRLVELHRVLKPTGSLYLHCDQAASHYLKVLLDAVFSPAQFRNDIVWKRKAGRGETNNAAIRFGVSTDTLLFYAKGTNLFIRQYRPNKADYIASKFVYTNEDGRRYRLDNITSPSHRPNLRYEYKGYPPPPKGWAVSRERMEQMDVEGRLYLPTDKTKRIQRKRFLDELQGETVDNLWDDIPPINSQADERIGFPTQKPKALLKRIIEASTQSNDVVLDPFCGCGTTIEAAEDAGRRWIGIDITHLAIDVIGGRLQKLGLQEGKDYKVDGRFAPRTIPDIGEDGEAIETHLSGMGAGTGWY